MSKVDSGDVGGTWFADHGAAMVAVRRQLHSHPEVAYTEHATTSLIAETLRGAGLAPRLLKGTGLTCDIGSGTGPLVALRADIDALPLQDLKEWAPYRSTAAGVAHACGHDVHTTTVLGAGLALAAHDGRHPLPGRVRLLFQPAEEVMPGGALSLIEQGALDGVDEIFGLHCDPTVTAGLVGVKTGAITSAADVVEIRLHGPGGHTSRPYRTVDLVYALTAVAHELPGLLSRVVDARCGVTLVWGHIQAGQARNAIPQEGIVAGTVRMLDKSAWDGMPGLIERLVQGIVAPTGAQVTVDYVRGVPPVVNTPRATSLLTHAATSVLGREAVIPTPQSLGGEDFAWYLEHGIPGTMFRLGVRPPGWDAPDLDLHQGSFDVDEAAIGVATRVLTRTALDALDAD